MPNFSWQVVTGLAVLGTMFLLAMLAKLFVKAGPNEALIVYGFKGKRVRIGHGTVVFPLFESCRMLSLGLVAYMNFKYGFSQYPDQPSLPRCRRTPTSLS